MEKEQSLAVSLAATAVSLAETIVERDQYKSALEWKGKKFDALMTEALKLRLDLSAANRELETIHAAGQKADPVPKKTEA
jgi:hypothetical protein